MSLITIIGIGNRLFCDDGIGNSIVEALSARNTDERLIYIIGETDIHYCLSRIQSEFMILIDAVQMGKDAGSIHVMPLNESIIPVPTSISMHNQHLLHLMQQSSPVTGFIIGIEPYVLTESFELSEQMKLNFEGIVDTCDKLIQNLTMFLTA